MISKQVSEISKSYEIYAIVTVALKVKVICYTYIILIILNTYDTCVRFA